MSIRYQPNTDNERDLKLNNTTGSKVVIAGKDFVLDKTASTTAGDKKLVGFKYMFKLR
ncbi:MAG: hypothetical protein H0A76_10085 [Candidatus Thiodubiliella endoseptemdiera]|uniref:Uncharacterized protein n=1 Tax=Candidatus Thiodubiliella endoseptemdiera TaxID=2738886 RepID=A0A853F971_9GAMM|nr:hypothetical protein [Candidatus Thiodubiliella endoseptemdiera]